jgi:hypothetical protein
MTGVLTVDLVSSAELWVAPAVLLCYAFIVAQPKAFQHFIDSMSSEEVWVVQEASQLLEAYERLNKAAKAQKVTAITPDLDTGCLQQCNACCG